MKKTSASSADRPTRFRKATKFCWCRRLRAGQGSRLAATRYVSSKRRYSADLSRLRSHSEGRPAKAGQAFKKVRARTEALFPQGHANGTTGDALQNGRVRKIPLFCAFRPAGGVACCRRCTAKELHQRLPFDHKRWRPAGAVVRRQTGRVSNGPEQLQLREVR